MSGICGFVGVRDEALLDRMLSELEVRGRDDEGKMFRGGDFALGYRGSKASPPQPAYNENGAICVVLDGELHNRRDLRDRLEDEGHSFSSDSDAELVAFTRPVKTLQQHARSDQ